MEGLGPLFAGEYEVGGTPLQSGCGPKDESEADGDRCTLTYEVQLANQGFNHQQFIIE